MVANQFAIGALVFLLLLAAVAAIWITRVWRE